MGTTNILDLNNRVSDLEKAVSGGDSAQANKKDIATEFSATTAYTAGCFVYYQGKLYQFNTDHAAGAWDSTDVVEANVTDQVVSNAAAIAGLTASDVAYDNTDSGLIATDVQGALDELRQADNIMLSDGVTSVEDAISKHIIGSIVSITNYTSESPYICPSDGYIRINVHSGETLHAYIGLALIMGITSATEQNIQSLRVNKGSSIYASNVTGNAELVFIPLQ